MLADIITIKSELERFAFIVREALYPKLCFGCHNEGVWFCDDCRARLAFRTEVFCPICRRPSLWGEVCHSCNSLGLKALLCAYDYNHGCVGQAIKACKYGYAYTVGEELGELLSSFWRTTVSKAADSASFPAWLMNDNLLVVPVPLFKRKALSRGFNQSDYLAQAVARGSHYQYDDKSLVRVRSTKAQARLSAQERLLNLSAAFAWSGEPLAGRSVLLVDDVFTTGATMISAAKVLRMAGAKQVIGLALASGFKH